MAQERFVITHTCGSMNFIIGEQLMSKAKHILGEYHHKINSVSKREKLPIH
jgi:hypothetical protein